MAGKHRAESSESSHTVAKVASLAGLAVTASLIGAGTADAKPLFGVPSTPSTSNSTASNIASALQPKNIFGSGGGFFTAPNPSPGKFPFGNLITGTNPAPTSGIGYITAPGTFVIKGLCLNRNGCN
jgi:hypothetical protein